VARFEARYAKAKKAEPKATEEAASQ
jgi:hypothetical protein